MRVLQLIDSLEAGGAERVAVNMANGLAKKNDASFLCTTRSEGLLKSSINTEVGYLNLKRTKTLDFKALKHLKHFIKSQDIDIIHAHSTSIYTAVLVILLGVKVKLVWHDHYGKSEFLEQRPSLALKFCSFFIAHVFAVNDKLVTWSKQTLGLKNVTYLANFVTFSNQEARTHLKGEAGFRIVCLANLRAQKDHETLINAFELLIKEHPKYTLHLIGKDFNDDYSNQIKHLIRKLHLNDKVFIYGSCTDTFEVLKQADIGILSSKSEGLPLSLLEYGLMGLPVVCTNVGDCNKVITHKENGLLIASENDVILYESLVYLASNPIFSKEIGDNLKKTISENFSENSILDQVILTYKNFNHGY